MSEDKIEAWLDELDSTEFWDQEDVEKLTAIVRAYRKSILDYGYAYEGIEILDSSTEMLRLTEAKRGEKARNAEAEAAKILGVES